MVTHETPEKAPPALLVESAESQFALAADDSIAEVEEDHIRRVLASVDGQMGRAAEVLGIHRNTLTRKMQSYQLEPMGKPEGPR